MRKKNSNLNPFLETKLGRGGKPDTMEVEVDVVNGRFKIIDELREENERLKENSSIMKSKEAQILDYADYIHYTVKTNNISLGVSLREQDNGIDREGTIYRLGLDHDEDREIYSTPNNLLLEDCIENVNEFIRINFKSDLFD